MEEYRLEKWVWTEADFEQMGWHDAIIYGIGLKNNLEFDVDYIFKWNEPEVEGFYYTFWIAPCTLVFERPTELEFELTQSFNEKWLEIENIERATQSVLNKWNIITQQGYISFNTNSFKQIVKQKPSLQFNQTVPYDERGGINFDIIPGNELDVPIKKHIVERKNKELEQYVLAKKRHELRNQLDALVLEREKDSINLKDFLLKKSDLKNKIDSLTFELRGTLFENW